MSARTALIEYLEALLPTDPALEDIRIVKSPRFVGEISKPILIVKTNSLSRSSSALRC
jgi:hypothetical protein